MSTKKKTANLPISYSERLAKESEEIQKKVSAPSGDRIRYNGNASFKTPDGAEGETMEVVIIDFISSNVFYEGAYVPGQVSPPACFAIGEEPTLLVPSKNSPNRQADACAGCPMNEFGSDGKGKACKNTRLLAVTPYAEGLGEDAPIWIMAVPPTSVKAFDKYVNDLANKHKTVPIGVLTEVSMDSSVTYAAPRFAIVQPLDDEQIGIALDLREEANKRLRIEPDVSSYEPPKPRGRAPVVAVGKKSSLKSR